MIATNMPEYLRVDEHEDAVNALEHAAETALTLERNPTNWKWVIISLHNALQGALVWTLMGRGGGETPPPIASPAQRGLAKFRSERYPRLLQRLAESCDQRHRPANEYAVSFHIRN